MDERALEEAEREQRVRLLAHSAEAGPTLFESRDRSFVMHLGHPEYTAARLCFEYLRDRELGRADVVGPVGVSLTAPSTLPLAHGVDFFAAWLADVGARSI